LQNMNFNRILLNRYYHNLQDFVVNPVERFVFRHAQMIAGRVHIHVDIWSQTKEHLMKKSLRALSAFTLVALLTLQLLSCSNGVSPAPASDYNCKSQLDTMINPDHPKAARYQAFLDSLTRAGMVGVSVLVSTPKDGIWAGSSGMADIAAGAPMKPCNLFRVFSITKTFTAVAILKLVEAGKLSLDEPECIILPLNLRNTYSNVSTPVGTVKGYVDMHCDGTISDATDLWKDFPFNAENGIVADIFDTYKFFRSVLKDGFLKSSSLAEMETLVDRGEALKHTGSGLGLAQEFSPYGSTIGHGGDERGYRSQAMYFKDADVFVIWFSNGPYRHLSSDAALAAFGLSVTQREPFYDLIFE
jgi:hypothetical protein